jgi:16S rRNA (uracil1498-N3)-methyltransferase
VRFYLPPHLWQTAQLDEAEAHHAQRVLRLQPGATITVFDGEGREASAVIEAFHKKNAPLRLGASQQTPRPTVEITLAQAIPKGRNMDLIIQKAVELGASRIIPLVTDRTIVRCQDDETKQERWQAIALEACKQCGQNWMPLVEAPCSLQASLDFFQKTNSTDLLLIASLEKKALPMKNIFSSFEKNSSPPISSATIFIGPEGDFTPEEYLLARAAGCEAISLGPIVLRTETAALYCLSVLAYELLR